MTRRFLALATACAVASAPQLGAQQSGASTTHRPRVILSIGNYPNVNGLRLNFRDRDLERVNGMNVTIWSPYEPASGVVKGIALGLPATGAEDIVGFGIGVFGVGASRNLRGVMLAPIGAGAGRHVRGIAVGGVGVGAGGDIEGLMIGGIGAGAGGNATGILLGGVGAGAGGDVKGIGVGGIGVGAGGDMTGIAIGGVGTGVGGDFRGIAAGGVGVGAGGNLTGLAVGGIGVGAGGTLRGIAIGGIGVGAPKLVGGFAAAAVGAEDAHAVVIAPVYFKIARDGRFRGGSLSAVNYIKGSQSGITIGLVNYARSVHGVQVGLVNVIADQDSHPFLPIVNWGSR